MRLAHSSKARRSRKAVCTRRRTGGLNSSGLSDSDGIGRGEVSSRPISRALSRRPRSASLSLSFSRSPRTTNSRMLLPSGIGGPSGCLAMPGAYPQHRPSAIFGPAPARRPLSYLVPRLIGSHGAGVRASESPPWPRLQRPAPAPFWRPGPHGAWCCEGPARGHTLAGLRFVALVLRNAYRDRKAECRDGSSRSRYATMRSRPLMPRGAALEHDLLRWARDREVKMVNWVRAIGS
jgi:hypothetical protein